MSTRQHASKRAQREIANNVTKSPTNKQNLNITKLPNTPDGSTMENNDQNTKIEEIYAMMKTMMKKLDTLEHIEKRIKAVEQDVKDLKTSLEYAHLEVVDIKKEFEENKEVILEVQPKIQNLEETNRKLQDNIIDLKA